jgi:hypothetical protein
VVDVEKCLTDDGNGSWFSQLQLSARPNPKREFGGRPIENNFAKLTPFFLWFRRYLSDNDAGLLAGRILERNMKVAVQFSLQSNNAARPL